MAITVFAAIDVGSHETAMLYLRDFQKARCT